VITLFNEVLDWVELDRSRRATLSLKVLQAEERERERLGRALYAGTAQTLAGVLVRMRVAARTTDADQNAAILEEVRGEVASALDEIRRMARRLHPPELAEIGVGAALEAHARHLVEGSPIQMSFEGRVPEGGLSPDARLVLLRVVQEALSNAVLHSGGSRVHTRFQSTPEGFLTEVVDNGRGFNLDRPQLFSGSGGLGLLGMRERAAYVSAALAVDSGGGAGTRIRLLIPWSGEPSTGASLVAKVPPLSGMR
jgi:two-component system sensor histidine kinase UhpB